MKRHSAGSLAAILILSIAGCGSAGHSGGTFDNTGGAPPPGNAIGFASVSFANASCNFHLLGTHFAALFRTGTDIPVVDGNEAVTTCLRTALADTVAALTADQAIGIFTLNLGGCVRSYEVTRVTRDGRVIRPWILLHDTTLGAVSAQACVSDLIIGIYVLRFDGIADANAMELYIGKINPNYPRNSDVPVF